MPTNGPSQAVTWHNFSSSGCGKAGEQMYLFLGQEEVEGGALSTLHTDLLDALQNIKQLQPPLTTLEGEKRGICAF